MESEDIVTRALYECEQRAKTDTPHSDHSWVQLGGKQMNVSICVLLPLLGLYNIY